MKKSPSLYSPEDDQIRDALRAIQQRKRLEEANGRVLRLVAWMLVATFLVVILRTAMTWLAR